MEGQITSRILGKTAKNHSIYIFLSFFHLILCLLRTLHMLRQALTSTSNFKNIFVLWIRNPAANQSDFLSIFSKHYPHWIFLFKIEGLDIEFSGTA